MGIQQDGQDATYPLKKLEEFIRKKLSEIWQGVLDGLRGDRRAQRSLFGMVAGGLAYLLSKKTIGKITENVRENSAAKEASRKALRDLKRQDKAMTTRKYRRERGYTFFATARLNHMKNFPEGLVPIMTKKLKDQKIVNVVLTKNGKYDVVGPSGVHLNRQLNEMYRMAVREKVQESILSGYNKYKNDLDKFVKSSQFRDMKTFNKDEGLNEQKDNFLKDYSAKKIACDKFSRHIYPSQHTMALSDFLKNKEEIKKLGDIKINYDPRDGVIQINSKLEDALKVDNFCNSKHIPTEYYINTTKEAADRCDTAVTITNKEDVLKFLDSLPKECSYNVVENMDGTFSVAFNKEELVGAMKEAGKNIDANNAKQFERNLQEYMKEHGIDSSHIQVKRENFAEKDMEIADD